jgi:hypothetical protein
MKSLTDEILQFDALAQAEEITGSSYKNNDETMRLGMGMFFLNNQVKKQMLQNQRDTYWGIKLPEYQQIIAEEGFELVQKMDIPETPDQFFVYWHPDGILLVFDTYYGDSVNVGKFYYNVKPTDPKAFWSSRVTSSGGFREGVWVGDHDCREALRHNIQKLRENGEFLSIWVECPFLWLLHYQDTKIPGYDYKAINEARIALLPEHVRKAITPAAIITQEVAA